MHLVKKTVNIKQQFYLVHSPHLNIVNTENTEVRTSTMYTPDINTVVPVTSRDSCYLLGCQILHVLAILYRSLE